MYGNTSYEKLGREYAKDLGSLEMPKGMMLLNLRSRAAQIIKRDSLFNETTQTWQIDLFLRGFREGTEENYKDYVTQGKKF